MREERSIYEGDTFFKNPEEKESFTHIILENIFKDLLFYSIN
jgi:hypothetical protein